MALRSRFARLVGVVALIVGGAVSAHAQSATLAWDANTEPNVTGYKIYYGTKSRTYNRVVDVGKTTTYTVTGLDQSLNYYFAVQAYNSAGLSSAFSSEVKLPAPVPPGTTVIKSLTSSVRYPLLVGNSVTWTGSATSKLGTVEYAFWLYSPSRGWTRVRDYSTTRTFTWTPGWGDRGAHVLQMWARSVGSTAEYEAWVATDQFNVTTVPLQVSANVDFPSPPGTQVRWTATLAGSSGGASLEYKFWLYNVKTGVWSVLKNYGTSNQATWTPSTTGEYSVQAWARQVGSTADQEVWAAHSATIAKSPLKITSFEADTSLPTTTGTQITWTARTKGGNAAPIEYKFWRYRDGDGWSMVQDYSTSNTYSWTPTWGDEGRYSLQVWARSAGSTADYEAWDGTNRFAINRAAVQLTANKLFPVPPGTTVVWNASVSDPTASFEYKYWVYSRQTGTWTVARPYSTNGSFSWTPQPGTYALQVWARQVGSSADYEVYRSTEYVDIAMTTPVVDSLKASVTSPTTTGTSVVWTATARGGSAGPLQYKFYVYSPATGWVVARDYSTSNTFTWTPTATGTYSLQVWVRSAGSTADWEAWLGASIKVQ